MTYLTVSPDEVIAKGSHLEGFSLLISDETGRGVAADIIGALNGGATVEEIHRAIGGEDRIALADVEDFLSNLHRNGAALRLAPKDADPSDWQAFVRYGEIGEPANTRPVTIAGAGLADSVAELLAELGVPATACPFDDLDDLAQYRVADDAIEASPADEPTAQARGEQEPVESMATDRARADSPQSYGVLDRGLVVVAEGLRLTELYELNERAVAAGAAILYVQAAGVEISVGPHVVPGATACFWEVEHQRSRSMFSFSEYAVMVGAAPRGGALPRITRSVAVSAVAPHIVELTLRGRSSLAGAVLRTRATSGETAWHNVMRLPRCPVCLPVRPALRNALF